MSRAYQFTTAGSVRKAFWSGMGPGHPWRKRNRDGDYCTDCRVEFADFVEMLRRDGLISESLAYSVTLEP